MFDAIYILHRLGMDTPLPMGGASALQPGAIIDFLTATNYPVSPYEVDAALLASGAYVREASRSNEKSTDAPWDWPKSKRDLEILGRQLDRVIAVITGE